MKSLEQLTVGLTPEMMQAIGQAVDSGEYASEDEVVRDALRLWRARRDEEGQRRRKDEKTGD